MSDLRALPNELDVSKLSYVNETIKNIKTELKDSLPLIGFIGSPWTVATYLVEGNSTKKFTHIKSMMTANQNLLEKILQMVTKGSIDYVNEQIKHGVDALMIFDTWGGLLSKDEYYNFSIKYIENIISSTNTSHVPIIYYSRSKSNFDMLKNMGIDCVGISSENNLGDIYQSLDKKIAVQGNFNPDILREDKTLIKKEVIRTLESFPYESGHVFNLGSGITPDIDPDKVSYLVEQVHEISSK